MSNNNTNNPDNPLQQQIQELYSLIYRTKWEQVLDMLDTMSEISSQLDGMPLELVLFQRPLNTNANNADSNNFEEEEDNAQHDNDGPPSEKDLETEFSDDNNEEGKDKEDVEGKEEEKEEEA